MSRGVVSQEFRAESGWRVQSGDGRIMRDKSGRNNDLERAVETYLQSGEQEALERVVEAGSNLVHYYARLYGGGCSDEDLSQAGYEGLLKALKRFDPGRNVLFATYATHCINGEIRRELRKRKSFKMPEWIVNLQGKIIRASEELTQENGRLPTLKEVAERINVQEDGILQAMQAGCVSLDELDVSRVKNLHYESFKLPIEDEIMIRMALDRLSGLQKKVFKLIYYRDMTQEQVAQKLGTNQRRVSRVLFSGHTLLKKILE